MAGYQHVNTLVVPEADSPIHGIHHFYMNDKAQDVFSKHSPGADYPAGAKIVGKVFKVVKTDDGRIKEGDLAAYTYMEKAPDSDEAQKTGGWVFRQFDAKRKDMGVDPVAGCFGCHEPHANSDYVMSEPLR